MIQILLLIPFLALGIAFCYFQQKTISLVKPENREIKPSHVWLQWIPVFNLVWQFFVVRRIAGSIEKEMNSPIDDSILGTESTIYRLPTYGMGLTMCISACVLSLPFNLIKIIALPVCTITWIIYWIQLAKYRRLLKERALITGIAI
jgi:hypothetical protein